MKDETYVFISDVKEKGSIGRSARHRKTHAGKGGRVRLPHDNLSKKELQKMNGECKSFRLNEPMSWQEFKAMPDDIKITYIKLLREKYDVPDCELCKMFGKDKDTISRYFKKLNLRVPRKNVHRNWKKDEWFAWVNGVDINHDPFAEDHTEEPVTEEVNQEDIENFMAAVKNLPITVEPYVEDDLPFEDPDFVPVEKYRMLDSEMAVLQNRIDELLKINEELMAVHQKDKERINWLEIRVDELDLERRLLEKQMDVVRLIFGRK